MGFNLQSLTGAGVVEKQEWLLGQSAPVVCDLAKRQGWAIIAKAGDLVILPAGCMILSWPMPGDTSADNGSPWGLGAGARLQIPGVYLVIFTIIFVIVILLILIMLIILMIFTIIIMCVLPLSVFFVSLCGCVCV